MRDVYFVKERVLTSSFEILKWLRQLFWVAWDGGFKEDFVVPVMDLIEGVFGKDRKTAGGWKPCKLDELEEFKSGPMGLFQKLERERFVSLKRTIFCPFGLAKIILWLKVG